MKITKWIFNKLNKFPSNFYSFEDGVNCSDEEIREWLVDVAQNLTKENPFSFVGTGNSIVIAFLMGPDEFGKYETIFFVSKNYKEFTMQLDLDQVDKLNQPKHFFDI